MRRTSNAANLFVMFIGARMLGTFRSTAPGCRWGAKESGIQRKVAVEATGSVEVTMSVEVIGGVRTVIWVSLVLAVGCTRSSSRASLSRMLDWSRERHFAEENAGFSRAFREKTIFFNSIAARQPDVTCQLTQDVLKIRAKMT